MEPRNKIVGGKVFVAPNGKDKVRVFRHGFVAPETEISEKSGQLIEECSAMAKQALGPKATPFEVFKFMGWTEELPTP